MNSEELQRIQKSCADLAARKNNDYGAKMDNIGLTGQHGISVRLVDKVSRVFSLTHPGTQQKVNDESIRDTLMDVMNYAAFGIMLLDGTWTGETSNENADTARKV